MEKIMVLPFIYNIDSPVQDQTIDSCSFRFSGWIASKNDIGINELILKISNQSFPLEIVERPDVKSVHKNYFAVGFDTIFSALFFHKNTTKCELTFKIGNEMFNIPIKFNFSPNICKCSEIKEKKLKKIFPILQCPHCKNSLFSHYAGFIHCDHCNARFSFDFNAYNFLTDDMMHIGGVKSTGNISSNNYDPIILEMIEKNKDKLILDNGAGLRDLWYENVVNFEIVAYPSTDVIGIGEFLPFKAESFDIVFSLNVLEHVKNPFQCAEEILRVLKPNGTLVVVAPFLQPYHGYPDHYYNMTSNGLKNLFDGKIDVIECFVPQSGQPIFCLTWFLNAYVHGLPEKTSEKFKNMKIGELLNDAIDYLDKSFVTELNLATNETLACTNYLIGQKK